MAKDKFGLRELPEDPRDFQLGSIFFLPPLEELPESFELPVLSIKNQNDTDYCSAYASCGVSELQEGVPLYPEYSFALSKQISGNVDAWGQDLRSAMKAHVKYGAMPTSGVTNDVLSLSPEKQRRVDSYPTSYKYGAMRHTKKSFFKVNGQYDAYDNIKAAIWKFKDKKQAVEIGVLFSWPLGQYVLDNPKDNGFGHAMYITGWTDKGLIAVNSYGTYAGKGGKHIVTRAVINAHVPRFGAYMLVDMTRKEAERLIHRSELAKAGFCGKVVLAAKKWWNEIWK